MRSYLNLFSLNNFNANKVCHLRNNGILISEKFWNFQNVQNFPNWKILEFFYGKKRNYIICSKLEQIKISNLENRKKTEKTNKQIKNFYFLLKSSLQSTKKIDLNKVRQKMRSRILR